MSRIGGDFDGKLLIRVVGMLLRPLVRRFLVGLAILIQSASHDHFLLLLRVGTKSPFSRIRVAIHNDPLDLGHNAVIHRRDLIGGHLRIRQTHRFAFGGHNHHFVAHFNAVIVAQNAWDHDLGAITHRVHRRVFDHNTLVGRQQTLQWHHTSPQIRLIVCAIEHVLGIEYVVHGHHVVAFAQVTRAHSTQFLHVGRSAAQQTQMNAQRTNVSARLTTNVEHAQSTLLIVLNQFDPMQGADTQSTRHRRYDGRTLITRSMHLTKRFFKRVPSDRFVETNNRHILFTSILLRFHQSRGSVNGDEQVARHFGIESTGVPRFLNANRRQNVLDPCHHFMRRRTRWLVQIDHTIFQMFREWPF
mmetsp:Transcript_46471/g.77221  ORF Transcript_46471/g.77221 Transcript_46471/m.77221 type:complete len:358 (-) Transcript_46471:304-1377(-)